MALAAALLVELLFASAAVAQDRILTAVVLINSQNTTGYNTSVTTPGEYQRTTERYLEHLQVPYDLVDVATQGPPTLTSRQLIIAAHSGLSLSTAWRNAIATAVQGGVGLVNLDSNTNIGLQSHIQTIFGATGSSAGTPGTSITVPAAVQIDGSSRHFIADLQQRFANDPAGDIVYAFHVDGSGLLQSVASTVLTGAGGTVIARVGADPLIVATTYGTGRAVHFGTLNYLRADRFGFLMGVDDLFWRSLVWAARKPFVLRGNPRLW
jgi:type 1 glutamine amidotransferase